MEVSLTVFAKDARTEERLAAELKKAIGTWTQLSILKAPELGQLIVIDEDYPGLNGFIAELSRTGDRRGRAVLLAVADTQEAPEELLDGRIDDVLVRPFRSLEVLSKIRQAQQVLMWDEVHQINASFSEMLDQLRGDLKLAERLQKTKLPNRFPDLRGFKTCYRYLAGMKSGGDHFEVIESKDQQQMSMVLSDSSSYGLSSAVLSTLVTVMMRLSAEETRSAVETVRRIYGELKATLTERDKLSLFYGVISRKDYRMRFLNLGSSGVFYAPEGRDFKELARQGEAITTRSEMLSLEQGEVTLDPNGRLAVVSDGFIEAVGGSAQVTKLFNEYRGRESVDGVNELVFRVKKTLAEDDLPAQDCTAAIFDLDARLIRLAN